MTTSVTQDATPRTRAKRGKGELLRQEILDVAESLLVDVGSIEAVSLRQVAKGVGCTPPSIYLHFADKDDLFFQVCTRRFEEFHDHIRRAAEGLDDPAEAMLAMGRAYVDYGLEHPAAYRVLFGSDSADAIPEGTDPETLPGMDAFGLLIGKIEEGIAAGVFRDVDPFTAAIGIWAMMHGLVLLIDAQCNGPIDIPPSIVDEVCRQALQGLLVR